VDVPAMHIERHEWDIHALTAEPDRARPGNTDHTNAFETQ
jgi:hypothetical protein